MAFEPLFSLVKHWNEHLQPLSLFATQLIPMLFNMKFRDLRIDADLRSFLWFSPTGPDIIHIFTVGASFIRI
jgi:hypothetical protein